MSQKYILVCDICGKEINTSSELYETIEESIFGLSRGWDICESCTDQIKQSIATTVRQIKFKE